MGCRLKIVSSHMKKSIVHRPDAPGRQGSHHLYGVRRRPASPSRPCPSPEPPAPGRVTLLRLVESQVLGLSSLGGLRSRTDRRLCGSPVSRMSATWMSSYQGGTRFPGRSLQLLSTSRMPGWACGPRRTHPPAS